MKEQKNWLIFGAGAIGTYIGGSLLLHGHRVTFLEQQSAVKDIRQHGLRLLFDKDPVHIPAPHLAASIEEALQSAPFDGGIFAIKSFDTLPVLENSKPHLEALPPIICFQNGVENEAILASFLGTERVIAGTITSAIGRRGAGDIVVERPARPGFIQPTSSLSWVCPCLQRCWAKCTFIFSTHGYEMVEDADQPGRKCNFSHLRPDTGPNFQPP